MRYSELQEEMKSGVLRRQSYGMGLETLYGDGFALTGGMRSGSSPPRVMRCAYVIIDTDLYQEETQKNNPNAQKDSEVGIIHVFKEDGTDNIIGAIDIKLSPKNRKAGIGRAVIQSLVETCPIDFVLFDIRPKAYGFWLKMGAVFYSATGEPLGRKPNKTFVMGVIRKPGSTTPLIELIGFRKPNKPVETPVTQK